MWQTYKQNQFPLIISILLLVLVSLLHLNPPPALNAFLQRLNAITYDLRMRASSQRKPNNFPPLFIIDVDEKSLEKEGRWPWRRQKLATLINKLHEAGSAVITLDITLTEPEPNPVDAVSQVLSSSQSEVSTALNQIRDQLDGDRHLARVMQNKGVILGYLFHPYNAFSKGEIKPALISNDIPLDKLSSLAMQGYSANLPILTQAASQNGFFTVQPDDDGVVRKAALILEHNQQLYTSLAVETAKLYLGADTEALELRSEQIGNIQTITHAIIGGQSIRTDASGQILIPYLGGANTFAYISATDVLHNKTIPDLTDAIVIIGTSAQALSDLRTTPFQPSYPGVEIQATLIHALLNPALIPYSPEWKDGATITLLVALSLVMMLLFPMLRPLSLLVTGFGLLAAITAFNLWLWNVSRLNFDLLLPALLILFSSAAFIFHRLIREHAERQRIHTMFGQYVPAGHIEHLLDVHKSINMDGERREMTVLFSDIRNFTAISEHLSTHQLKDFLNHYLTAITAIIFKHQGTIDKYIGDLVMAFWGAPLYDPKHAEHAVTTALNMRDKTQSMQSEFKALGIKQAVKAGIGIHTGDMNVGDMGSTYRRAYTVLGDAVNLGARLESLTKQYGILILVSEDTVKQCSAIVFRQVDFVRVKGRQKAVRIYEPVGLLSKLTSAKQQQLTAHQQALDAYLSGSWGKAFNAFSTLFEQHKDPLYQVYLQRIKQGHLKAPANWDGIFTHTSK